MAQEELKKEILNIYEDSTDVENFLSNLQELQDKCSDLNLYDLYYYEDLKNYVIYSIENDNILLATHILNALNNAFSESSVFSYDMSMGSMEEVTELETKKDLLDQVLYINDLQ